MKNGSRLILYILLALIIISGFLLLIFNNSIVNYLQKQSGLTIVLPPPIKKVPMANTINPQILNSPRLATLVNNVIKFNFTNICWRPDTILTQPTNLLTTASSTALTENFKSPLHCVKGNGLPFLVKKK